MHGHWGRTARDVLGGVVKSQWARRPEDKERSSWWWAAGVGSGQIMQSLVGPARDSGKGVT